MGDLPPLRDCILTVLQSPEGQRAIWEGVDARLRELAAALRRPDERVRIIAAAIRAAVAEERERCAGVADAYAARMLKALNEHARDGRPTNVADSKRDAGKSIAAAIREEPT